MSERVGVVGLGIMGSAMAANLLGRGFPVTCYDIEAARTTGLLRLGAQAASSPAEVAAASELVITSLPSAAALERVTDSIDGVVAGAHPELVVAETSTLPLRTKATARDRLAAASIPLLDCPISGTGKQAQERDIVFYASGDKAAFERAAPPLGAVSRAVHYLGEFGAGSKTKYIANLLVAVHNLASAEAMLLAQRAGLDPATTLRVVSAGAGNSRILELRGPLMVTGEYEPATATIDMFLKDVAIIGEFATELSCPTPLLSACAPYYAAASARGWGHHDAAVLCAVLEQLANSPRDQPPTPERQEERS